MLLFGGARQKSNDVAATNEFWAWNGTTWTKLTPWHLPPPPFKGTNHLCGFDGETGAVVFDGGYDDATQMTARSGARSRSGRGSARDRPRTARYPL